MTDEGNPVGQGFDWFRHGDGSTDSQQEARQVWRGGEDDQTDTTLPPTVFVSGLGDGALFLQSWPTGLHIYLSPLDAQPLRHKLISVFQREARLRRSLG